uniref:Uncharacterized protein n=1 Tax=Chromera velia CCMP2878 TaxID=1169474 RepID=A0A0G4HSY6_9ALVE|eukprot:Cvel_1328.t1-p1 / transcript=Cvel_1328.t1 / gene=Cvel_1328 / organism=Chromera_velia_CCMP2878 / gene_product=hypothetical protein / transcript_product=hypothetical protein / location=Cvel_scaffold45:91994-93661(+) / protein_length=96 / sequence_SO=supercontig / SO=protein_coding / is_pseudo=false
MDDTLKDKDDPKDETNNTPKDKDDPEDETNDTSKDKDDPKDETNDTSKDKDSEEADIPRKFDDDSRPVKYTFRAGQCIIFRDGDSIPEYDFCVDFK